MRTGGDTATNWQLLRYSLALVAAAAPRARTAGDIRPPPPRHGTKQFLTGEGSREIVYCLIG